MADLKYKLYGKLQALYHQYLKGHGKENLDIVYVYSQDDIDAFKGFKGTVNGTPYSDDVPADKIFFKGENVVIPEEGRLAPKTPADKKPVRKVKGQTPSEKWFDSIEQAKVEKGWVNSGFYLNAYIKEDRQWCLSNWIWVAAAVARALCLLKCGDEARDIADAFLREQRSDGSWIVRFDCLRNFQRIAAANDSAYISRNALLTVYDNTKDEKYLDAAKKCAKWIMDTSDPDGLAGFGYDVDRGSWIKNTNIVDVGYSADLFAELYRVTGIDEYKQYLENFIDVYINVFYDRDAHLFYTHCKGDWQNRKCAGGYFSRGHAWAMEGLIPAYQVLKDPKIFNIMEDVTDKLCDCQAKNGGWDCNFQKKRALMGQDCKGVAAIAKSMLVWANYSHHKERIIDCAKKAYDWCVEHTDPDTGAIVSFTTNGAISHTPNRSVGILYANAYALESEEMLRNFGALK